MSTFKLRMGYFLLSTGLVSLSVVILVALYHVVWVLLPLPDMPLFPKNLVLLLPLLPVPELFLSMLGYGLVVGHVKKS